MKRIVIISCYLSGQKEIDILNRCIEGYKQTNWDIMIVGHLPIDKEIANKVTNKRIVTPNKIQFASETFTDINDILDEDRRRNML